MKIIFMGTPEFAVPCLRKLAEEGHTIDLVVTQPDRPKGRGRKLTPPPVKIAAEELGLEVYQPEKVKSPEAVAYLKDKAPELIVVVAFGQLLSREILDIPPKGCINVHASLLPKYRGAAPIHWAVIDGEQESGVCIMFMDEGLDTGDVLLEKRVPIGCEDTTGDLHDKLAVVGAEALGEAVGLITRGQAVRTPQPETGSCYAVLLNKDLELIDWSKSSEEIRNLIRGLNPWPGAHTYLEDRVLKVWAAAKMEANPEQKFQPGEIIDCNSEGGLTIATGDGALLVTELQLQGSKKMKAGEFVRGHKIAPGTKLGAI